MSLRAGSRRSRESDGWVPTTRSSRRSREPEPRVVGPALSAAFGLLKSAPRSSSRDGGELVRLGQSTSAWARAFRRRAGSGRYLRPAKGTAMLVDGYVRVSQV